MAEKENKTPYKSQPYSEQSQPEDGLLARALYQSDINSAEFDKLISLLTSEQKKEIEKLSEQFSDPELFIERVKNILPEAIARRGKQDKVLTQLLTPTVEEVLESSTKQDPEALAIKMLPTIRSSIKLVVRETFNDLITNLNSTLDHSLNLNWRLEAWRTGRPFSEVVLSKTLVYRVEQIFLIHAETGILLNQAIIASEQARDGDIISGMLTAIQDFVRDSFKVDKSETLNNFQVGELSVLIEQDEAVFIAAVVRGIVPAELDDNLQRTVSLLQMRFRQELKSFTGDTDLFEDAEGALKTCLTSNFVKPSARPNPMLWVMLTFISIFLLVLAIGEAMRSYNWSQALNTLESEPGIIITKAKRAWNRYQLKGLLDPLAKEPSKILQTHGISLKDVKTFWEPYYSLDEAMILKRAQKVLMPPHSVSLSLQEGTLKLVGSASASWKESALITVKEIIGIEQVDTLRLYTKVLDFDALVTSLEAKQLYFESNSETLLAGQESIFELIKQDLVILHSQSLPLGYKVKILIIGYSNDTNCKYKAPKLAEARAQNTLENLTESLPDELSMSTLTLETVRGPNQEKPHEVGKVSFKVVF